MTWPMILLLCAGILALRSTGVLLGPHVAPRGVRVVEAIGPAVLGGLTVAVTAASVSAGGLSAWVVIAVSGTVGVVSRSLIAAMGTCILLGAGFTWMAT